MTSILGTFRIVAVSGALLTFATSAASQPAGAAQGHDHADRGKAAATADVTLTTPERIAALDKRIQMLSADMRMFSGEMKVEVMASLISAMLERQALVEGGMKTMREAMMRRMSERQAPPPAPVDPEPESMCGPTN